MSFFLRIGIVAFFLLATRFALPGQSVTLGGYIKDMEGVYFFENALPLPGGKTISNTHYNLIHNRLNLKIYPIKNATVALEIRNRVFFGPLFSLVPGYANGLETDPGLVDLSWNLVEQKDWFFNTTIDRAFVDYTLGNWEIRIGRQRINWGINLVWNPNDLFNAFSFTDFDYEERPGSDAVLLTWYPTFSSSFDLACKAAKEEENRTLAARYRFNLWNYDFQVLAGQTGYDYVVGGGWSGNIRDVSFRGEASWFLPRESKKELSDEALSATVSFDYTTASSFYIHASFLYNSMGTISKGHGFSLLDPNQPISAKKLSIGRYELFGQLSYSISPIVGASLATLYNPVDYSMFVSPALTFSLHDVLELLLTSQILLGEQGTEYAAIGNAYTLFGRIRWSF
ncbi:MAG TPA: hypothetical protein PLK12_06565 [Prolixibacteraceae bacterium]|nr:hypothetical protein [Prolixibacteraceae bacterium]